MNTAIDYFAEHHIALGLVSLSCWTLTYLIISFFLHYSLYMKKYSKLSKVYISEASVSIIQGFLCGGVGLVGIWNCRHDVMGSTYMPLIHYRAIGTGYFVYDLVAMYYSNLLLLEEKNQLGTTLENFKKYLRNCGLMVAHHIILTAILSPALLIYSPMGHFFAGCFYCMEISSPFVNFRIILSKLGLKSSKLYLYNGILMMVVFAIFRVLVFLYMYVLFMLQMIASKGITMLEAFKMIPFVCHFSCLVIMSPQIYWLSLMINGVYIVLTKRPKALDKYD